MAFTTKLELFASPTKKRQRSSSSENEGVESTTEECDSKRTYQALLQNQVLGIENPYLLHEIHNVEDYHQSQQLYTRMQKQAENMESFNSPQSGGSLGACSVERSNNSPENHHNLLSKGSLSPFMAGAVGADLETSPYKSKLTVLKFSASPTKSTSPTKSASPSK